MAVARFFILLFALFAASCGEARGNGIAAFFSGEIRQAEKRLGELESLLASLPKTNEGPQGSRYGFRSETIANQLEAHWVQVDLGQSQTVDGFALMPVGIPSLTRSGDGYGFPLRFKIEVADNPGMRDATMVIDRTAKDVKSPGRHPLFFPIGPVAARFVRVTSTKHLPWDDGFIWALEEFLVLSGNRNIAVGRAKRCSSSLELFPNWSQHRVNDGMSRLGLPVDLEPSPTKGYLSAPARDAVANKWAVIDLMQEYEIQEIRLLPVESDEPEVVGGRGYPRDVVVELSNDPGFAEVVFRKAVTRQAPLGHPFGSAAVAPCDGRSARYLRVLALELFARGALHSFALAEIQVYAGGENVALGKKVTVPDRVDRPADSGWAPEFLVDGYSSKHHLVELPQFLKQIAHRGRLERERKELAARREKKIDQVTGRLIAGGGTVGALAVVGFFWMIVRARVVRRADSARLREQIARDLHDDIGSNLGGIALLSELGAGHENLPPEVSEEFREIKATAEMTSEAMRDIVWLIDVESSDLHDLVLKMRESVERMLGHLSVELEVAPENIRNRQLSLLFRRHFFLAFKETLNNVLKHAGPCEVRIDIVSGASVFTFKVKDTGCGFDYSNSSGGDGHGLRNLEKRAARLKGTCVIESVQGRGTSVTFEAPLKA